MNMRKKVLLFFGISVALVFCAFFAYKSAIKYDDDTTGREKIEAIDPENLTVAYLNKDAKLSDIKKEKGKVNIYMFWGSGCPHCKTQWEYLESIRKDYPNDFNVYGFEVWNNDENRAIMDKFMEAKGDTNINSVPYTIIGDQSYSSALSDKTFIRLIKEYKDKGIDVYFDKIK